MSGNSLKILLSPHISPHPLNIYCPSPFFLDFILSSFIYFSLILSYYITRFTHLSLTLISPRFSAHFSPSSHPLPSLYLFISLHSLLLPFITRHFPSSAFNLLTFPSLPFIFPSPCLVPHCSLNPHLVPFLPQSFFLPLLSSFLLQGSEVKICKICSGKSWFDFIGEEKFSF